MTSKNPWGNNSNTPNGGNKGGNTPNNGNNGPELDEMLIKMRDMIGGGGPSGNAPSLGGIGLVAAVLLALWLLSGLFIVQPGHEGVVQRFGAWERTKDTEGLSYRLPFPIETVELVNVQEVRRLPIGVNNEGTQRIAFRNSDENENLMLTTDANIVDISLVVFWKIQSAEDYLFRVDDQINTIKKVGESALREVVSQTEMTPIITNKRAQVEVKIQEIMQANLDDYQSGVRITQVLIQNASVHPDVEQAFNDVQGAKQDAENVQNQADRYKGEILPVARGQAKRLLAEANAYKEAKVARATGDAKRFDEIYSAYLSGKDVTKERIYIETMEEVLSNAQVTVIDSESNGSGVIPFLPLDRIKKD